MSRRARLAVAAIALASAGGVALGGLRSLAPGPTEAASPEASTQPRPATATAERRTLTVSEQLDGTLGYAGEQQVVNQLAGTLTRTPSPGDTVRRGETLY